MTGSVATVVAALVGMYAAACVWLWRRESHRPLDRDRIVRAAHDSYEGPDSLRLLEDLEAHMKAYGEKVADFYDTTPGGPNS